MIETESRVRRPARPGRGGRCRARGCRDPGRHRGSRATRRSWRV